jgi:hypothetical protein
MILEHMKPEAFGQWSGDKMNSACEEDDRMLER